MSRTLPWQMRGGLEQHAWTLAKGLAAQRATVRIYTTSFEGARTVERREGIDIVSLPHLPKDYQSKPWWTWFHGFARACRNEYQHGGDIYDLVVSEMLHGRDLFKVLRKSRTLRCYVMHGSSWQDYRLVTRDALVSRVGRWHPRAVGQALVVRTRYLRERFSWLKQADVVVAVSPFVESFLREHYRVPPQRVRVIGNAVAVPRVPGKGEARRRLGLEKGRWIVYLGRLEQGKGVSRLLDLAMRRPDWNLLIAGAGPEEERVRRTLEADPAAGARVRFLNGVDEATKWRCYAAADVLALPSLSEGEPLVILEALAAGRPCATTAPWVAPDLQDAVAVDPDPERAIERAFTLGRAAAAARLRVLRDHSTESQAKAFLGLTRGQSAPSP